MEVHTLRLGDTQIINNLFLAPMAGFTDYAFRSVILPLGAGLSFTELTSAKGLYFGAKNNYAILRTDDHEKTAAQIFGSEPYFMRWAVESEYLKDYKIVDINMGCPVPKIVKNGEGSALLADIKLAESIIKECVKSGKIITVKIRTGIKTGDDIAAEFAKMAEGAGASLITIHGRVRENYYSGEPDYNAIYRAKRSVHIPVIANGGIFNVRDADDMVERTGADGVMIARGAIADPFIFSEISGDKISGNIKTVKDFAIAHLRKEAEISGDARAAIEFRKFVTYYFKSVENAKQKRAELMLSESAVKTEELLNKYL
ncbi:MAG: tRNA-dihydrouridine synthase family protein [Clostridia bacterium]|nr:tRNA-dihydrouridine synthase family protein [Clostridia bacterium]